MNNNLTKIVGCIVTFASFSLIGQNNVGIGTNTPDPSSVLELNSTGQGMLVPRMSTFQRNAIVSPAEALLVYDTDFDCFYFFRTGTGWQDMCSGNGTPGPAGPVGPTGPAGPIGATGPAGAQGPVGPIGATGAQGPVGPIGATGPAGANGLNGTNGTNGVDGLPGPAGPQGPAGPIGATGPAGANGLNGTNGTNGVDGLPGPAGPQGPAGPIGATGPAGANGLNGTNGTNGVDGLPGPAGAQGPAGPIGATGPVGATGPQGPSGIVNRYHVRGTAGRTGVTSTVATLQPGMTQAINLTAASDVMIVATIGALNVNTNSGQYSTVDMILYVDGTFLPLGGWNRFTVVNPTGTNGFNTCTLNAVVNLAPGAHTIELRTARLAGSTAVNIGGNSALDTNPGEMTILILN